MTLLLVSSILFIILLFITFYLNWKMFEKAAVEGWWCLIPFANTYKMYKIAKLPVWLFVLSFIFTPVHLYAMYKLYRCFNISAGYAVLSLFIPYMGLCMIVYGTYEYNFD